PAALTAMTIANSDGDKVVLEHSDDGWRLPDKHDISANSDKLKQLVEQLDSVHPGLPVAVSADAQKRFHVAAKQFERHVVLKTADGTAADVYLGKSAGAGRLYARLAGDKAIQDISLPLWRVSAKTDDWLDKTSLAADTEQLKQV